MFNRFKLPQYRPRTAGLVQHAERLQNLNLDFRDALDREIRGYKTARPGDFGDHFLFHITSMRSGLDTAMEEGLGL